MKTKIIISILILSFFPLSIIHSQNIERPKLVVGIIVDQMRYDFLTRYMPYYSDNGFKRLVAGGTNFTYAHFNYSLTSTGPGHSSVYSGTTPYYHGIIGNDWFDRSIGKNVNCVEDTSMNSVGSNDKEGHVSPRRLQATTITDELKLATFGAAKVISVSLKDRSAVLPGGHMPDGAYWFDNKTGDFITSSYYMNSLPKWVVDFNKRKLADMYLNKEWNLSLPESEYRINAPDESNYEKDIFNEGKTSFPHLFGNVKDNSKYNALEQTPFCNSIVKEIAKAALVNENLGKGTSTDFLCVSFSSTDKVQHAYGSNSYETEDTYIKLDSTIADLLNALDKQVGKNNYLLFLTADHAGNTTPSLLKEKNLPTGGLNTLEFRKKVEAFLKLKYGSDKILEQVINKQIYLNRDFIKKNNLNIHEIEQTVADYMRENFPAITTICTRDFLEGKSAARIPVSMILNGFNPVVSGDIFYEIRPGYLPTFESKGTNHGSPYTYDTHVPLIFYGWHVSKEIRNEPVYIVDIAATLANMLTITEPSACIGIPLLK